jgi:hypothetical protein
MTELVETTSKQASTEALTADETETLKFLKGEAQEEESSASLKTLNTLDGVTFKDLVLFLEFSHRIFSKTH